MVTLNVMPMEMQPLVIERSVDMHLQPFTIHVAQGTLDDLRERLARIRWPDEVQGAGWDYGTNLEYLKA